MTSRGEMPGNPPEEMTPEEKAAWLTQAQEEVAALKGEQRFKPVSQVGQEVLQYQADVKQKKEFERWQKGSGEFKEVRESLGAAAEEVTQSIDDAETRRRAADPVGQTEIELESSLESLADIAQEYGQPQLNEAFRAIEQTVRNTDAAELGIALEGYLKDLQDKVNAADHDAGEVVQSIVEAGNRQLLAVADARKAAKHEAHSASRASLGQPSRQELNG